MATPKEITIVAFDLDASVGSGGVNDPVDVTTVKTLLSGIPAGSPDELIV